MRLHVVAASTVCLAVLSAPLLHAQQAAPLFRRSVPDDSLPPVPRLAPLPTVFAGGLIGGAVIGGAAAGVGAALLAPGDDHFISSEAVGAVFGLALGYPIGVALGTRYAAAPAGHRPSARRMLLTSAATAGLGALIWTVTGQVADDRNPDGDNMRMWYIGAAAGSLVHLGATSFMAWQEARRIRSETLAAP